MRNLIVQINHKTKRNVSIKSNVNSIHMCMNNNRIKCMKKSFKSLLVKNNHHAKSNVS